MRERLFIALPVPEGQKTKTIERADNIKRALSKRGYYAVSPFDKYFHRATYEETTGMLLSIVSSCNAVYFTSDWETSTQCRIFHYAITQWNEKRIKEGKETIKMIYDKYL